MRWLIALALPIAALAQIQDLATTADGSVLYFSSAYRQKGTTQPAYLKIFRMDSSGLTLFRALTTVFMDPYDTNYYLAERPSLSADGSVVGYTQARYCEGGSHCIGYNVFEGALAGSSDQVLGPGTITVSPDGNSYLLSNVISPINTVVIGNSRQQGLTGYSAIGDGLQSIANNGIALITGAFPSGGVPGPSLWQNGQVIPLSLQGTPVQARIDAAGDMFIYETVGATVAELRSYSIASATDVILASGSPLVSPANNNIPLNPFLSPSLTLDGKAISYILNGIVTLQPTNGGSSAVLTSSSDGFVVDAVISGDGNVAYAATDTGRLLRIDLPSGVKTELIAAPPQFAANVAAVPGARFDVTILFPTAGDPALIGANAPAPVLARSQNGASQTTVTLQIPWEATVFSTVQLVFPSLLEQPSDYEVIPGFPVFYSPPDPPTGSPPFALAAHQDFSAIVTPANPASAGEIVHFYFTGLGAVSPAVATGAAAPSSPLSRLVTPFSCQFTQGTNSFPAGISFAGLAPGTIGIEQVDIEIPPQLIAGATEINCMSADLYSNSAQLPVGGPSQQQ